MDYTYSRRQDEEVEKWLGKHPEPILNEILPDKGVSGSDKDTEPESITPVDVGKNGKCSEQK